MNIVISSGHGKYIRGARGNPVPPQLDEVDEARRVVEKVAEFLRSAGVGVKTFHDNTSHSQDENLRTIVNYHNNQSRDLDISIHFNAYTNTSSPMGCEVLYVSSAGSTIADKTSAAISEAGDFIDRGHKKRTDLYFLNNTEETAIIIETCFCDSTADSNLYKEHFDVICEAIAESVSGETIEGHPPGPEEPGPEPPNPADPVTGVVVGVPSGDQLNIRAEASSSTYIIGKADNGDVLLIVAESGNWLRAKFGSAEGTGVAVYGWVSKDYVDVTGDVVSGEPEWRTNITATEFGGGGDDQDSAYPDIDWINSSTRGVALPYKWKETPRPQVIVKGPNGEVIAEIVDLGPWNTNDPNYVLDGERPLAETQYDEGTEAQNGQVPSNNAGIDLTPPIADAVGISGKGKVSWRFA